jgi:hypothetical protein
MTLAKREDGPLVVIGELVRYRPSAFRRGHRGRPLGRSGRPLAKFL